MQTENSLNPAKGKLFQKQTDEILSKHFDVDLGTLKEISVPEEKLGM